MGLPQVPHRGTDLELAGQPLGPAEPPANVRLISTAKTVQLSSKVFLLSADDTLHALACTAFMRMLRQEDSARVPDYAGQRVRQASVVVQVVDTSTGQEQSVRQGESRRSTPELNGACRVRAPAAAGVRTTGQVSIAAIVRHHRSAL